MTLDHAERRRGSTRPPEAAGRSSSTEHLLRDRCSGCGPSRPPPRLPSATLPPRWFPLFGAAPPPTSSGSARSCRRRRGTRRRRRRRGAPSSSSPNVVGSWRRPRRSASRSAVRAHLFEINPEATPIAPLAEGVFRTSASESCPPSRRRSAPGDARRGPGRCPGASPTSRRRSGRARSSSRRGPRRLRGGARRRHPRTARPGRAVLELAREPSPDGGLHGLFRRGPADLVAQRRGVGSAKAARWRRDGRSRPGSPATTWPGATSSPTPNRGRLPEPLPRRRVARRGPPDLAGRGRGGRRRRGARAPASSTPRRPCLFRG